MRVVASRAATQPGGGEVANAFRWSERGRLYSGAEVRPRSGFRNRLPFEAKHSVEHVERYVLDVVVESSRASDEPVHRIARPGELRDDDTYRFVNAVPHAPLVMTKLDHDDAKRRTHQPCAGSYMCARAGNPAYRHVSEIGYDG